jgi:hypothetical protein
MVFQFLVKVAFASDMSAQAAPWVAAVIQFQFAQSFQSQYVLVSSLKHISFDISQTVQLIDSGIIET